MGKKVVIALDYDGCASVSKILMRKKPAELELDLLMQKNPALVASMKHNKMIEQLKKLKREETGQANVTLTEEEIEAYIATGPSVSITNKEMYAEMDRPLCSAIRRGKAIAALQRQYWKEPERVFTEEEIRLCIQNDDDDRLEPNDSELHKARARQTEHSYPTPAEIKALTGTEGWAFSREKIYELALSQPKFQMLSKIISFYATHCEAGERPILVSGSNRQSPYADSVNEFLNQNGYSPILFEKIAEQMDLQYDPVWWFDFIQGKTPGSTGREYIRQRKLETGDEVAQLEAKAIRDRFDQDQERILREKLDTPFADESKLAFMLNLFHYYSRQFPNDTVKIVFIDDKADILRNLYHALSGSALYAIPANIEFHVVHHCCDEDVRPDEALTTMTEDGVECLTINHNDLQSNAVALDNFMPVARAMCAALYNLKVRIGATRESESLAVYYFQDSEIPPSAIQKLHKQYQDLINEQREQKAEAAHAALVASEQRLVAPPIALSLFDSQPPAVASSEDASLRATAAQ